MMKTTELIVVANNPNTRSPTRMLSLLAVGLVMVLSVLGHALMSAPEASAVPAFSDEDRQYIELLADAGIDARRTYYDVALEGRQVANDVRWGASPLAIANDYYYGSDLTWYQAKYLVTAAIVVYAPEMLPPSVGGPSELA
ncbi:hypothetical protein A6B34_23785 [Mycolicibacterium monacense]|nr:hypothetical protein A6B34_23785 [Mycolicibacterium monacense]